MNEFAAKKLGEVHAFCKAGIEILDKGSNAISNFEKVSSSPEHFEKQASLIEKLADKFSVLDQTLAKSEKTQEKLLKMAQMYIGDDWDDSAEILEWLGFFEGAAIVHWKLVEGVAKQVNDKDLLELAEAGVSLHTDLLAEVAEEISEFAQQKV